MTDLDALYNLQEDPDGYLVLYDLCLINGWADSGIILYNWRWISNGSRCGYAFVSYIQDNYMAGHRYSSLSSLNRSRLGYVVVSSSIYKHEHVLT
jgi:hypothetical protein